MPLRFEISDIRRNFVGFPEVRVLGLWQAVTEIDLRPVREALENGSASPYERRSSTSLTARSL